MIDKQTQQKLLQAFHNSIYAQNHQIKQATLFIEQLSSQPTYLPTLITITDNSSLELTIRMAALANLKTHIQRRWKKRKSPDIPPISQEDRNTIKNNLVQAVLRISHEQKLVKIYKKIISTIAMYEYPKHWSPLVKLSEHVTNQKHHLGFLVFIDGIVSQFQLSLESDRQPLQQIIPFLFPFIRNILDKNQNQQNFQMILYLSIKIFWRTIHMDFSSHIIPQLPLWKSLFTNILLTEISLDLPEVHNMWKAKKWIIKIIFKMLSKYFHHKLAKDKFSEFAKQWRKTQGVQYSKLIFKILPVKKHDKCQYFLLKCLPPIIESDDLSESIKDYLNELFLKFLPQYLILLPSQIKLIEQNPIEFIHERDSTAYAISKKSIVMECYITSIQKSKYQWAPLMLKWIEDQRMKQAILQILTKAKDRLSVIPFMNNKEIQYFLNLYILKQLNSPYAFMRAKACEFCSVFANSELSQEITKQLIVRISTCLTQDSNLYVRSTAAQSLTQFLHYQKARQIIKPHLQLILKTYIQIIDKVDSEQIVTSLQTLVKYFDRYIPQYATQLVKHLSIMYHKYWAKSMQQENGNKCGGQSQLTASGCLSTIKQILQSDISVQMLKSVQGYIISILNFIFTDEGYDDINEGISLLAIILKKLPEIPRSYFIFFPVLLYLISSLPQVETYDIQEYNKITPQHKQIYMFLKDNRYPQNIQLFMPVLKNFIKKGRYFLFEGKDIFGKKYIQLLFDTIHKIIKTANNNHNQTQSMFAISLFFPLIENYIGLIDNLVKPILEITLQSYQFIKAKKYKVICLQLISMLIYYNPKLTIGMINEASPLYMQSIVQQLMQNQYKSDWEKQRIILGFVGLLQYCKEGFMPKGMKWIATQADMIVKIRQQKQDEDQDSEINKKELIDKFLSDLDDAQEEEQFSQLYTEGYQCPLQVINELQVLQKVLLKIMNEDGQNYKFLISQMSGLELQNLQKNIAQSKEQYNEWKQQNS